MKPPRGPLDSNQDTGAKVLKRRDKHRTEVKRACWDIVTLAGLQYLIGRVHAEYGAHQSDLDDQNQIGIQPWPRRHLGAPESWQSCHVSSDQKDKAGSQDRDGQKLKDVHQDGIDRAEEGGKDSVGTRHAVDHKLEHLEVDDEKSEIDKKVKDGRNNSLKHFSLTKRNEQDVVQPLTFIAADVILLSNPDVLPDPYNTFANKKDGDSKDDHKSDLLNSCHPLTIL